MSMLTPPSPRKRLFVPPPTSFSTPPSPTRMSRLSTLSTPGRMHTPPNSSGLPTPTHRRPRSSLGPVNASHLNTSVTGDEMDQALQEVLKKRPPSSLKGRLGDEGQDVDSPSHPPTSLRASTSYLAPRTPGGLRPRTPSTLAHTPSASRAVSRSSAASSRPSITGTNTFTPRRTSMASSTTSTTPFSKRPESRASMAGGGEGKFAPVIGDKVRIQSMGMEGTLRYIGETEFKAGVWAGVELEGGFAGQGKNDGSVNGVPYFTCPPNCGVFVLAAKLSPPTAGISRPVSVASSHRSLASSHASYTLSGRMTPADRPRPMTTTPGRATRSVSSTIRPTAGDDDEAMPAKTLLGTSTSSNALMAASKITAGSRASKYLGMTAKQLDNARAGTLNASVRGLRESTATTTPKASRVSMNGVTPVRPRQSIGGNFATPKARAPRASTAMDMMPPPPSPGNIGRTLSAHQAHLDEEIRELKKRNAELEAELKGLSSPQKTQDLDGDRQRMEALQGEVERIREEADSLRSQLFASQADAADASKLAEELQGTSGSTLAVLEEKESELAALKKEMQIAAERAQSELDAGMEAKREEVKLMLERAEVAEGEAAEMRALVEDLTQAGQATISLYETKQYDFEDKIRALEEKSRSLEEKLAKAREEQAQQPGSPQSREAATAAEIDNETLTAQLKHLQQKQSNLEEELEETRAQAEADAESWKNRLSKAKDGERAAMEREREIKEEVRRLQKAAEGAKGRIGELEGALKENNSALEAARADVEGLRGDAAEASSLRAALQDAAAKETDLAKKTAEVEHLNEKVKELESLEARLQETEQQKARLEEVKAGLEAKVVALEAEITSLKSVAESNLPKPTSPSMGSARKSRVSTGSSSDDDSKRLRGFQHIIAELSAENAELKEKYETVLEEVSLLKEEIKLLEETNELGGVKSPGAAKELAEARSTIKDHVQTIEDLNREVSELESLIESKIYREDELETRLVQLQDEVKRYKSMSANGNGNRAHSPPPRSEISGHSRAPSMANSTATEDRCELCEGPHDLDACPVFAGNMSGEAHGASPLSRKEGKKGRWCADCESDAHDTTDCPMAEEVF